MNDRQDDKRKMFGKVLKFGEDYAADFPADSRGAKLFTRLKAVVARIDLTAARQSNGGHGGTLSKHQALDLLDDLLDGLAVTARTVALALNKPELRADLRLTRGANETELLTDAQRVLDRFNPLLHDDAAVIKVEFLELEVQADFLTRLAEYKTAVETAREEQDGGIRTQTGATELLSIDFAEGMGLANELNTLCENRYGRNPETKDPVKLREWRQARHIDG